MDNCGDRASSSAPRCAYDIFLSFRGEDTRKNFTDHLYVALSKAGFHTFRDDDGIRRGENIESELQKAIEESRISLIVFSKTYATSRWCLDELVKILHRKRAYQQHVLPIFYDVDPSDVRKQTKSFAEAFTSHEKRFGAETDEGRKKVEHWREALKDVADLGGMVLQNQSNGYEANFIQKIVKVIADKLNRKLLSTSPFLIGIHERVKDINLWLQDGAMEVSVIAICGMGGIGKTTVAKFVYNLNRGKFDGSCFLANIRERAQEPNGLVKLQKQFLSDVGKHEKVSCVDEGIIKITEAICCKRLLLVLDDVDHVDQLNAIFGMRHLFSPGSKVIVTTRHEWLLNLREVHKVHKVDPFNVEESLELFSWHAFGQPNPIDDFLNLSNKVIWHCGGLPLALQVLGSSLSGKTLNVWESALDKLEAIPDSQILEKLKISYDSLLDDHDKDLFLHIACFFTGCDKDTTITILDKCDFFTTVGIQNLIDRCLMTVCRRNKLRMHKLLQDMGREIVRQESPKNPGARSRLWNHKVSFNVLREKTGTSTIEGLILDMHKFDEDKPTMKRVTVHGAKKRSYEETLDNSLPSFLWNSLKRPFGGLSKHSNYTLLGNSNTSKFVETIAFSKMCNLKLLQLNYIQMIGQFENFPESIRWLRWHGFPLTTIPSHFPMESLVVLDMHYSNLEVVWKGTKFLEVLKILDLSHSHGLVKTPDLSGVPNLERLILEDCINLVEIHDSIGKVESLVLLNLKDCRNLKKLPRNICMLKYLNTLIISGCSNLDWWPTKQGATGSLKVLHHDGVSVNEYASKEVKSWHAIIFPWVSKPPKSPEISSISLPCSLVKLSIAGCNLFDDDFPLDLSNLSSLKYLDISSNQFCSLPEFIRDLTLLQTLEVDWCVRLKSLTGISNVKLERLIANNCSSLEKISYDQSTLSSSLNVSCAYCDKLIEVEGHFKFEPVDGADIERLKAWGFFNLESVLVNYYILSAVKYTKKLSLQRLSERGVHSYFFPGDKIPSGFSIRSEGESKICFLVPPPPIHYKIIGLVVCSIYTRKENFELYYLQAGLSITMENRTKQVSYCHSPVSYGMPNMNEDMTWISHWNIRDLLDGGDKVQVFVEEQPKAIPDFEVKDVGILILYGPQEDMGNLSIYDYDKDQCEDELRALFPYPDLINYSFGGQTVVRHKRLCTLYP